MRPNIAGPDGWDDSWDSYSVEGCPPNLCFDFGGGGAQQAAREAAQAQSAGFERAAQIQREMYNQTRADLGPGREVFAPAINQFAGLLNLPGYTAVDPTATLRATPGYEWQLGQGINALDSSAAARGGLFGGAQQKALLTYGQGLADQTYQNYLNNIYKLVGTGQNAAAQTGQFGANAANQMGQAYIGQGNALAQGLINSANARQSAYNSGINQLVSGLVAGGSLLAAPFTGGASLLANMFTSGSGTGAANSLPSIMNWSRANM